MTLPSSAPASPSAPSPTADPLLDDEDYNSEEDEDFDPSAAPAEVASDVASDDDNDDGDPELQSRKRKRKNHGSESPTGSFASDSGGEGGLVKTRAQRAREGNEKIRLGGVVAASGETDVDELWRQMNSKPKKQKTTSPEPTAKTDEEPGKIYDEETVTISRTYTFAGKSHTELKTVPKDSQEARTYLSSLPAASSSPVPPPANAPARRPPPKKRASIFDAAAAARKPAQPAAQKMNTLEKSRLDWAGFVDKEGIGEELKKHTRGDKAYLDRQAFLGRVEEKRDQAWKEGQKKG